MREPLRCAAMGALDLAWGRSISRTRRVFILA
jgi:hypothetical protein